MRYLFGLLFLIGVLPSLAYATNVTKIEWSGNPGLFGQNTTQQQARCPRASESGDTIVVVGEAGANNITGVTDDKGQTYTADKTVAGGQFVFIYRFSNSVAGARVVTIAISPTTGGTQAQCFIFNNIQTSTPVDVSCGQDNASNTSQPCGSMTTTVAGDEILHCAFLDTLPVVATPPTWTANSGFYLAAVHNFDALACELENQASAGAINPTMMVSSAIGAANVGVAYKTAVAGGSPLTAAAYVPNTQWLNFSEWGEQGGTALGAGPYTVNFPCDSNSHGIDVAWESNALTLNSISSSPANTWTLSTTLTIGGEKMGHATASVTNCSSAFTITYTLSGTPDISVNSFMSVIWAIRNTSGLDTINSPCNTTGTSTAVSGPLPDNACATSIPNEVLLSLRQNVGETVTSSSVTNGGSLYDQQADYGGTYASFSGYEDGGAGITYAPTAGMYTITWNYSNYESSTQISNYLTQTMVWTGVGTPYEDYWSTGLFYKAPVIVTIFSGLLFGVLLGGGYAAFLGTGRVRDIHSDRLMGRIVCITTSHALSCKTKATSQEPVSPDGKMEL